MPEMKGHNGPIAAVFDTRRGWIWLGVLVAALVALRGATLLYTHSLNSVDGAMQTWFALSNFADGAALGSEFQSYLGITMILTLLPGFIAFGETLWASTFAAYTMVMVGAFVGAAGIVWMLRPLPRSYRWFWTILLVFAFYYAADAVAGLVSLSYPATLDPGVSLRPLRGALAFFVLPVFVWSLRRALTTEAVTPIFWLGVVMGAGLLWSNDAGIPLVIAGVIGLAAGLLARIGLLAKSLFAFVVGAGLSAVVLLMLVSHGDPSGWIAYNFTDVASDQFWYFGPWDRSTRILSILDVPWIFLNGLTLSTLSLNLLTLCAVIAGIRRLKGRGSPVRTSAFLFLAASVLGAALIPQIGGHIGPEYNAITFVLGVCAPIIVFQKAIFSWLKALLRRIPAKAIPVSAALAALAMTGIDAGGFLEASRQTDRDVYSTKLGFFVTPKTAEDLAAMERLSQFIGEQGFAEDRRLLSVYTSSLDIAAGTKSPAAVGSLIHALGERNRIDFNELLFSKTVAVTTLAPDYTGWAEWNTRANWSFFKNLRDLYRPIARNDQHILWVRAAQLPRPQDAQCEVTDWGFGTFTVTVNSTKTGMASLFFEREGFEASSRSAVLTVSEQSPLTRSAKEPKWSDFPRYGIANQRMIEVAVPVEAGTVSRLKFSVLDGSAIGWGTCFARVYEPVDYGALPSISEGVDALIEEVGA